METHLPQERALVQENKMKISKVKLQQIIKEELSKCMADMGMMQGMPPMAAKAVKIDKDEEENYDGKMSKANLYNMAKHASMLHNLIEDTQDLEPWVQEKIAIATEAIETVAEYMEYEKIRGHD